MQHADDWNPTGFDTAARLRLIGAAADHTITHEGAVYTAQIDAAILANQGDIEGWYVWAEERFQKPRGAFSAEDYVTFLEAVRNDEEA
jgi:hypothetical protein